VTSSEKRLLLRKRGEEKSRYCRRKTGKESGILRLNAEKETSVNKGTIEFDATKRQRPGKTAAQIKRRCQKRTRLTEACSVGRKFLGKTFKRKGRRSRRVFIKPRRNDGLSCADQRETSCRARKGGLFFLSRKVATMSSFLVGKGEKKMRRKEKSGITRRKTILGKSSQKRTSGVLRQARSRDDETS